MSLIETPEALRALVARAMAAGVVAVDTEFVTGETYFPKLGLIQIGLGGKDVALVDPLAACDLAPLGDLLGNPDVVKVLHDPDMDLKLLNEATGTIPENIFDTRRAAGFVGLLCTISLADLLAELFGVELDKSETRSDWLRRPLSPKQCAYAEDDVRYLCQAFKELQRRAARLRRTSWLAEEMKNYNSDTQYAWPDPHKEYLRFSGLGKLSGRQRAALKAVAAWRENAARSHDLPRQWILPDKVVRSIAQRMPQRARQLRRLSGVSTTYADRAAEDLLRELRLVRALPHSDYPPRPEALPSDDQHQARVHLASALILGHSVASGIDPALVATRNDVRCHVSGLDSPLRSGWRHEFVGRDVDELLQGRRSVNIDDQTGLPALA